MAVLCSLVCNSMIPSVAMFSARGVPSASACLFSLTGCVCGVCVGTSVFFFSSSSSSSLSSGIGGSDSGMAESGDGVRTAVSVCAAAMSSFSTS